jgi:hypothetical protein
MNDRLHPGKLAVSQSPGSSVAHPYGSPQR